MSKPKSQTEGADGDHNAPIVKIKSKFERIGAGLYRYRSSGVFYSVLKKEGKTIWRNLQVTDKPTARRLLAQEREDQEGLESRGESCIIGHDGWGYEGKPQPGFPGQGPYHGVLPGIYNPTNDVFNLGRLGRNEQALVIADIDPVYSVEGKPRPQMLPPPLSLVAHLPVIECRNPNSNSVKLKSCCQQHQAIPAKDVEAVANKLFNRLKKGSDFGWRTTAQDDAPEILGGLLSELAALADRSSREYKSPPGQSWLRKRQSSYLREYMAGPRAWPPPVALDWLWVDVTKPPSGFPTIEVPPYSLAPNEKPPS